MIERQDDRWIEVSRIGEGDPRFDVLFWQEQGPQAIFEAAWEMVVAAHTLKGGDPADLQLDRSQVIVRAIHTKAVRV